VPRIIRKGTGASQSLSSPFTAPNEGRDRLFEIDTLLEKPRSTGRAVSRKNARVSVGSNGPNLMYGTEAPFP
jgi:hypothetical protein